MYVIADAGSTKTYWRLVQSATEFSDFRTDGLNPFFHTADSVNLLIATQLKDLHAVKIDAIYFYGAGCIPGHTDLLIRQALQTFWPQACIEIRDDMWGAARGLLGNSDGIACILGTGANSCLYRGGQIVDKVPTLGFILGDEGSGAYLGKQFLNRYFKRDLPTDLMELIAKQKDIQWPDVLQAVYRGEFPNRYLASWAPFLKKHREHPYMQQFLIQCFDDFFKKNILKYDKSSSDQIYLTGSIAYYFESEIRQAAAQNHLQIGAISINPIEGLSRFHQTNENL